MSLNRIIQLAFLVAAAGSVSAQDWATFKFIDDGFRANFPGEPTMEPISYDTEFGMQFPGRIYHAADALGEYSMTVVDSCQNDFAMEVVAAIDHAVATFLKREGIEVTQFGTFHVDRVLGRELRLTNDDGSRTYVGIHQHTGRLYIHQAEVAAGMPEPILFMQSLGWVNAEGLAIRYFGLYSEGYGEWQFPQTEPPSYRVRDMETSLERPSTPGPPPPPR